MVKTIMKIKLILPFISLLFAPASQALTLNGNTGFGSVLNVNASVSGIVQSIKVKAGQRVKKGDVLLVLDNKPHKARLDRARAIEKSLLPAVQTAELELERAQELYDRDSLSQVELKNAEIVLAQAEGSYQAASADVVLAKYQLANTIIYSPINGRVLQLHSNNLQYVDPAVSVDPLITLVESRQMKAIALVNSDQWDQALINKKATVQYREKQYEGKVNYLGYKRIKQSSGLPAYEIHVVFKTDSLIPAEMPVKIEIKD